MYIFYKYHWDLGTCQRDLYQHSQILRLAPNIPVKWVIFGYLWMFTFVGTALYTINSKVMLVTIHVQRIYRQYWRRKNKTLTVLCWSIPSKIPVRLENTGLSVGSAFQHFCITAYLNKKLGLYMLNEKQNSCWFMITDSGFLPLPKRCFSRQKLLRAEIRQQPFTDLSCILHWHYHLTNKYEYTIPWRIENR